MYNKQAQGENFFSLPQKIDSMHFLINICRPQSEMRLSRTMDKFYSKLFLSIIIGSLLVFTTLHRKIASHKEEFLVPAKDIKSLISKNVKHTFNPFKPDLKKKEEDESRNLVEEAALQFSADHEIWKNGFSTKLMNESTNIILFSYLGSGVTLIGDLLSRKSNTIYFNDPILLLNDLKVDKVQILKSLFECDFKNEISRKYLENIQTNKNSFELFYTKNPHLLRICRDLNLDLDECIEDEKISEICSGFQNRLILIQNATLNEIQPLVLNYNVKLIFMTRDPRGLIFERHKDHLKDDKEIICKQYIADSEVIQHITEFKPKSVMTLVYERFVFKPLEVTDSIYTWLSWKKNEADIQLFIQSNPLRQSVGQWIQQKDTEIDEKCLTVYGKSLFLGELELFEKESANKILTVYSRSRNYDGRQFVQ